MFAHSNNSVIEKAIEMIFGLRNTLTECLFISIGDGKGF